MGLPGLLIWEFLGPLQGTNQSLSQRDEETQMQPNSEETGLLLLLIPGGSCLEKGTCKGQKSGH